MKTQVLREKAEWKREKQRIHARNRQFSLMPSTFCLDDATGS
jgi:hypothetical protein